MNTAGQQMLVEIGEQPQVLDQLATHGRPAVVEVADVVRSRSPRFVLLAARGTSDHAALYLKYLVEVVLGLPAGLMSPSTITAYGARPDLREVLVIGLSQSGGSPDLVQTLETARRCGATTLALTNNAASELAAASELHVDVMAGPEHAVAATKTYTAELLASWLLVDAVHGGDGSAARALPETAQHLVSRRPEVAHLAERYRSVDRLVLTARGYSYPTAREAALKLMETSYVAAHAFSGADLMHGPLAMIDDDRPVLAIVPEGVGATAMRPVLERLSAQGADLAVFGGPSSLELSTVAFPFADQLPEELAPIVDIVPLQLLALEMALARGLDPDQPRGLSKVTQTW